MDITFRPVSVDELEMFSRVQSLGFGFDYSPERVVQRRRTFEAERSLVALDGTTPVGTTGAFTFEMTVPGGVAPVAGVTSVSVIPTHRRRGILTSLMRDQLVDVRERGEPLAALWASESGIYARFGYGLAADTVDLEIERTRTALCDAPESPGTVRLVSQEEALARWPALYERVRLVHPGFFARSETWWDARILSDFEWMRDGATSHFRPEYVEDGEVRGYAVYRIRGDWPHGIPKRTVEVLELMGETPAANAALWRYIFGVDLVEYISAQLRSADEPLYAMLADSRRLQRIPRDGLWVRVVDVPAALTARRYASSGAITLEVRDSFVGLAEGRFALEGGPEGALCKPTDREPEVTLSATDLGALYMGAQSAVTLGMAGRVQGSLEALRQLDALFRWTPTAWCPEIF